MFMRRGLLGSVIDHLSASMTTCSQPNSQGTRPLGVTGNDTAAVGGVDDRAQGKVQGQGQGPDRNNNDEDPDDHTNAAAAAVVSAWSEGAVLREAFARQMITAQQITQLSKNSPFFAPADNNNQSNNLNHSYHGSNNKNDNDRNDSRQSLVGTKE